MSTDIAAKGIIPVDVSEGDQTLSPMSCALMVGIGGDVAVVMADGSSGVLPALLAGVPYRVQITGIKKAGTTANKITVLY